jgi:hypothetical protein
MGLFLNATAVRDVAVADLIAPIESWCSDHFVACSVATAIDLAPHGDAINIFDPIDGWTLVMWPGYFSYVEEVGLHLSNALSTVVSAVSVYDSDCWQQSLTDGDQTIDRYATDPRYLTSDLEELSVVAARWKGDPQAVAALLGCDARAVARHYKRNRRRRTFDDWDFVELWATEGITYAPPAPVSETLILGEDWSRILFRVKFG